MRELQSSVIVSNILKYVGMEQEAICWAVNKAIIIIVIIIININ